MNFRMMRLATQLVWFKKLTFDDLIEFESFDFQAEVDLEAGQGPLAGAMPSKCRSWKDTNGLNYRINSLVTSWLSHGSVVYIYVSIVHVFYIHIVYIHTPSTVVHPVSHGARLVVCGAEFGAMKPFELLTMGGFLAPPNGRRVVLCAIFCVQIHR